MDRPWLCTCGARFPDNHAAITIDMPFHSAFGNTGRHRRDHHVIRKVPR